MHPSFHASRQADPPKSREPTARVFEKLNNKFGALFEEAR
jgi:hypothetical protein